MNIKIVITFAVIVLILYWFFSDHRSWKERIKLTDFRRRYIGLTGIVTYILFLYSGEKTPLNYGDLEIPIVFFGFIIFLAGFNLALWARQTMGESWNLPGKFYKNQQKKLIKTGPFRYTRNPIYLGLLLLGFGSGVVFQSPLVFLILLYYIIIRYVIIPIEEKSLKDVFGKEYEEYCRFVPRIM